MPVELSERELLDASGIEPPDTDLPAWGSVMGFEEARVREQVATAQEEAIAGGDLSAGGRGFPDLQAEVAEGPFAGRRMAKTGGAACGRCRTSVLERWLQRGPDGRTDARRAVPDGVAAMVSIRP